MSGAIDFLASEARAYPDLAARYQLFSEHFSRKCVARGWCRCCARVVASGAHRLWHQLGVALDEFFGDPSCSRGDNLIQVCAGAREA
jgi:hypothetical protein